MLLLLFLIAYCVDYKTISKTEFRKYVRQTLASFYFSLIQTLIILPLATRMFVYISFFTLGFDFVCKNEYLQNFELCEIINSVVH